jgi:cytochrome b561
VRIAIDIRTLSCNPRQQSNPEDPAMRELNIQATCNRNPSQATTRRTTIDARFARLPSTLRANSTRSSGEHGLVTSAALSRASRDRVPARRHHPFTRMLHWTTFALLIVAAVAVCAREFIGDQTTRRMLLAIHEWSGLTVLALIVLRLAWRAYANVGRLHAKMSPRTRIVAALGHYTLYATTLALPVLGWLTANAYGHTLRLFGLLPLPTLMVPDPELGYALQDWHVDAACVLLALVLGHVAAAFWHHYVRRNGVLRSMQLYVRRRERRRPRAATLVPRLREPLLRYRQPTSAKPVES